MLSSLLPLLTLISPIASISLPARNNQQPLPNNDNDHKHLKAHFRDIEHSDLAAITTIIIEAFAPSAAWTYLIPDLAHHKAEVWACYNSQIEQAWPKRDKKLTRGKVITVPDESSGGEVPVSFSFWNIRSQEKEEGKEETLSPLFSPHMLATLLTACTMPPGTNLTRAADFTRQNDAIERKYFEEKYPHQLFLHLLATHPDWDGNDFGARHCEWGMNLSRELEPAMPVTLLASPAGFPLYDSLGFESVKNATMTMLDGLGELWFEVMEWDGNGK